MRSDSIDAASPKPFSTMLAPFAASVVAMPNPIPLVDPVTNAVRPLNMAASSISSEGTAVSPATGPETYCIKCKMMRSRADDGGEKGGGVNSFLQTTRRAHGNPRRNSRRRAERQFSGADRQSEQRLDDDAGCESVALDGAAIAAAERRHSGNSRQAAASRIRPAGAVVDRHRSES